MSNSNLIKLTLTQLACNQQSLAKKIGVSAAQISKWKSGEYMSSDMQEKLTELAGIGEYYHDFVYWTGGLEQSKKWYKLISDLAELAARIAETGYITSPLEDEEYRMALCEDTISILRQMGVTIPQEFPAELIFDQLDDDEDRSDLYEYAVKENPISKLIFDGFQALNDLYGFYAAYISYLVLDPECTDLLDPAGEEIESYLLDLAFVKTGSESDFAPTFIEFRREIYELYTRHIETVKNHAIQHDIPLKWELKDLVSKNSGPLGHYAESESLGINKRQLHPDIYMDEILRSLRSIHVVLPIICKKLGITEEDFTDEDFGALAEGFKFRE